jgi:hypothetical protein
MMTKFDTLDILLNAWIDVLIIRAYFTPKYYQTHLFPYLYFLCVFRIQKESKFHIIILHWVNGANSII